MSSCIKNNKNDFTVIEKNCVFQALAVKMRRLGAISRWLCKCSNTGCVVSCAPTVMSAVGQGQLGNLPGLISKV